MIAAMNVLGRLGAVSVIGFFALNASLGCGASPPPDPATGSTASTAAAGTAAAGEAAAGDSVGWHKMSHEQKMTHMKTVIMPKMSEAFQAFNGEQYKDMNCGTCHGPGAKQGKFGMPTDSIVKLNPADHFAAHMGKTAEATKFMMEKVVPEMAKLQGEAPYDPATQKGFGCFECHMMEK